MIVLVSRFPHVRPQSLSDAECFGVFFGLRCDGSRVLDNC